MRYEPARASAPVSEGARSAEEEAAHTVDRKHRVEDDGGGQQVSDAEQVRLVCARGQPTHPGKALRVDDQAANAIDDDLGVGFERVAPLAFSVADVERNDFALWSLLHGGKGTHGLACYPHATRK